MLYYAKLEYLLRHYYAILVLLLDRIIATNPMGWTSQGPFSYISFLAAKKNVSDNHYHFMAH